MRWFPSLALIAQYRATTERAASGRHDEIFGGVQATWLLWDGGERIADREERLAGVNVSELEARALSRRIAIDVRRALSELELGQAEVLEANNAAECGAQEQRRDLRAVQAGALARALGGGRRLAAVSS